MARENESKQEKMVCLPFFFFFFSAGAPPQFLFSAFLILLPLLLLPPRLRSRSGNQKGKLAARMKIFLSELEALMAFGPENPNP